MVVSPRTAGRPRDASLDAALLTATQDLLLEQGFDRVSVDSIALRAGVGKAAIYRRWPGKTALVVAAVADLAHMPEIPDTGTLRGDLLVSARSYIQNERTQRVLAGLMTAMVHHEELRVAARDAIGRPFAELFTTVVLRAIQRGLVPPTVNPEAVGQVFPALAFHRGASLGLAVDDDFVVDAVDGILLPLLR